MNLQALVRVKVLSSTKKVKPVVIAGNFQTNRNVKERLRPNCTSRSHSHGYRTTPHLEKADEILQDTIRKAKEGNQIAFSTLLDRFWNDVYGFQLVRTQNENDAEDISIQTFSKAFDRIETYDDSFEFKTWLIAISKNLHVDLLRKRKRNVLEGSESGNGEVITKVLDDTPTAEDQLITEQNLASLLQHIKKLKPHYQKVINLRYFNEMSYAEIANELGEPVNNIKVKLLRAKKLLAEIIKNSETDR